MLSIFNVSIQDPDLEYNVIECTPVLNKWLGLLHLRLIHFQNPKDNLVHLNYY